MPLTVEALYIYPVKSCQGIAKTAAVVGGNGFEYDRLWMVVDGEGKFLTQRTEPRLGSIETLLEGEGADTVLTLREEGTPNHSVSVPLITAGAPHGRISAAVWGHTTLALCTDPAADLFIAAVTGRAACRLVQFPHDSTRPVSQKHLLPGEQYTTAFSDGYPFLMVSTASLNDVAQRAERCPGYQKDDHRIDVRRFRPNLVISGVERAYEEDRWSVLEVGSPPSRFVCTHPCERCVLTTINPDTHRVDKAGAPSHVLTRLREGGRALRGDRRVYFGQNAVSPSRGASVQVGDTVRVVSLKQDQQRPSVCAASVVLVFSTAAFLFFRAAAQRGQRT